METTRTTHTNPTTGRTFEVDGPLTPAQLARVEDIDAVANDGVDRVYTMRVGANRDTAAVYVGGRYSLEARFVILVDREGGVINADDELVREYVAGAWQ